MNVGKFGSISQWITPASAPSNSPGTMMISPNNFNNLSPPSQQQSHAQSTASPTQFLADQSLAHGNTSQMFNLESPCNSTPCTTLRDMDLGTYRAPIVGNNNTFNHGVTHAKTITVPLQALQQAPKPSNRFWCRLTLDFSLPAIRHRDENYRKPEAICDAGCKDKTKCKHGTPDPSHQKYLCYFVSGLGTFLTHRLRIRSWDSKANRLAVNFQTNWVIQHCTDSLTMSEGQDTGEETGQILNEVDLWLASKTHQHVNCTVLLPPFQEWSQAFPISAIQNPAVLEIDLPELDHIYYSGDNSVPMLLHSTHKDPKPLTWDHINVRVFADYLDSQIQISPERPISWSMPYIEYHEGLLDAGVARNPENKMNGISKIMIPICGEVLEVLWVLQMLENEKNKDWFNWRGCYGEDVADMCGLQLDNEDLVTIRDSKIFRRNHHFVRRNKPKYPIYGRSFVPKPDESKFNNGSVSMNPIMSSYGTFVNRALCILLRFQPYVNLVRYRVMIRRPNVGTLHNGGFSMMYPIPADTSTTGSMAGTNVMTPFQYRPVAH